MLGQDPVSKMGNRGGLPIKNIVTAIFILLSLYLLYIYNVSQNRLHDTDMTAARYRREAEERVKEIQTLISAKDDFQERCEDEKRQYVSRINSINQKQGLLESQNKEVEADLIKVKQDMENLRAEHAQTEAQHAQEYQDLKQNKDREILDITDQVNNAKQLNDQMQSSILSLKAEIQSYKTAKETLIAQNSQLQALQEQQKKQLELQLQNEANARQAQALQEQQKQMNVIPEKPVGQGQGQDNIFAQQQLAVNNVDSMKQQSIAVEGDLANAGVNKNPNSIFAVKDQAAKIDELNAMNQAKPPGMDDAVNEIKPAAQGQEDQKQEDQQQQEVNPNDLQQVQLREPLKQDGGEVDKEDGNSIRDMDEKREKEELANQAPDHNNPLDFVQMQQPLNVNGENKEGEGNQGQQMPPLLDQNAVEEKKDLDLNPRHFYENKEEEEDEDNVDENDADLLDKKEEDPANAWHQFNIAAPHFGEHKDEGLADKDNVNLDDQYADGKADQKDIKEEVEEEDEDYGGPVFRGHNLAV